MASPEDTLKSLMECGLAAADPYPKILENLPQKPTGQLFILSVGKAATPMAKAASDFYRKGFAGILYAPKGYVKAVSGFKGYEGTHPVPSKKNVAITRQIMDKVAGLEKGDLFLALISGGTSALLCAPKGITLEDKIRETKTLLASGKPVSEINKRRKELSRVKGGKLAELAKPARVETLIVSDVAGDNPAVVGSAPTGGGKIALSADDMLAEIAQTAQKQGFSVTNLGQVEGEAREVAKDHAGLALGYYGPRPHLILSGGETSVTLKGKGTGGRNTEYGLALCLALKGAEGVYGLAVDTDGHDGTGPFAGAMFTPETLGRAGKKGLNPKKSLKNNDSGGFFKAADGLIITGQTLTNVNDLRMILLV